MDRIKVRTEIIEHLAGLAKTSYEKLKKAAQAANINWQQVEKAVLIRSIDMVWIEHLDAMDHMRRGIGLRGYGQRDPLVEYKKEAYHLYNELNNLIQKQVVYSIFKIGDLGGFKVVGGEKRRPIQYSAPEKEMKEGSSAFSGFKREGEQSFTHPLGSEKQKNSSQVDMVKEKVKDASGKKVGRNDPCPCGARKPDGTPKKFKHCCGK